MKFKALCLLSGCPHPIRIEGTAKDKKSFIERCRQNVTPNHKIIVEK